MSGPFLTEEEVQAAANAAVTTVIGTRRPEITILCEHGGKRVPPQWNNLGLPEVFFDVHFGHDLGATALTLRVAERLGATAIISNYSRLFLDYNRKVHQPECRRIDMGGIPVPGNLNLSAAEIELRERIARHPVEQAVARQTEVPSAAAIISIHSFSPYWNGEPRSCEIGVMWRQDDRLSLPLIKALQRGPFSVEDNQPYSFQSNDWFTLERHGTGIGLPHAYFEIRNDLLADQAAIDVMAEVLASGVLGTALFDA